MVHPGRFDGRFGNAHASLPDLGQSLARAGHVLQRVERGSADGGGAINLSLDRPPSQVERLDIDVHLAIEPYRKQRSLNAKIRLGGLRNSLRSRYGIRRGGELSLRVFLPDLDAPAAPAQAGERGTTAPADGIMPADVDRFVDQARQRVLREISARRGSGRFRDAQRRRFGDTCAITGCRIVEILDAAHIRPYGNDLDNAPSNGLLLRTDIHTLFDLGLLRIDPGPLTVWLAPDLRASDYRAFHGVAIRKPATDGLDHLALRDQWLRSGIEPVGDMAARGQREA